MFAFSLASVLAALGPNARSQDVPPTPAPAAPMTVEQLAQRLMVMEEMNRKLASELARTTRAHEQEMRQLREKIGELSGRPADAGEEASSNAEVAIPGPMRNDARAADTDPDTPVPDYTEGQFDPFTAAPGYAPTNAAESRRLPLKGTFGPGFQWQTEDEEFRLQVHYESQIEARIWAQSDQVPANGGIFLPRQRIFFNGNITKAIEYELAINRGFGAFNLLNAFVNLHFDDRFEVRIGRFFTPLPYDQYAISNYWLPTPERSLFTTNLSLNRQFGMMGWGYLFDKRLDYAAGVFNGSRNSFESLSNSADFVGYLNARPFQESESLKFARFWNIGSSVAYGYQNQAAVPQSFRIAGGSPNADVPGPGTTPFLILNRDVVERGERLLGSVHSAYFYKGLSLIGEWQYGYGGYASANRPSPVRVPFSGFYLTGGYFLTGEHVDRRARLKPLRPVFPTSKGERRGVGAWEVVGRYSDLRLGEQIFTGGFADPSLWSNQADTTEIGLNWYLNEYLKVYMFWLHGEFGDPVQYRPGGLQKSADMFWMRFQLYF
ncbi:OprO/OprP family phosphate-selective porin [Paludisphaera borealis]|uniref:Porin O n=1 Tax=Paludisphaera borealis TaxID=1387353 RepID=A0A1U7CP20_9BACT|nr:porin [Paludisphaera borealis]APW60658.1 Porin O [Paludisphaera borealis]